MDERDKMSLDSSTDVDHSFDASESFSSSSSVILEQQPQKTPIGSHAQDAQRDINSESSTSDTITQSAPAVLGQTVESRSSEGSLSEVIEAVPTIFNSGVTIDVFGLKIHWPKSRLVKIEKRAEGFGFTLRNVVVYPQDIHRIANSLGKKPKDVEPSWCEGKPLDVVLVREVRESGAAQRGGLRPGDRIVAIDQKPIESYSKFVARIHQCSCILEVVVLSGADDPLSCGLWPQGLSTSLSRSVNTVGSPMNRSVPRAHWLSSSLAPRPYLSTYQRGAPTQPRSLPNNLIQSSPIHQSTVSLTESTTGGSASGAESEMSLSLPSIPIPPSISVPSRLDASLQRKKRREVKKKHKREKATPSKGAVATRDGSRSSSLSSLGPPSPGAATTVAAKLQIFEGGQGFLARSMEKLKLYRSELTRMASPPPNTVQVRTAQFEKVSPSDKKTASSSGTTSPPPGATLKKLKTLFTEKSMGSGCALKVLKCPESGKKFDHNWRPAEVTVERSDTKKSALKIVTDKETINTVLARLLDDPTKSNLTVTSATMEHAKRRKNVLRLHTRTCVVNTSVRECALCPETVAESEFEFLIQCDTPVTMHNICSVINSGCSEPVKFAPSVIERAAAFDRRFFKNHHYQKHGYKPVVNAQVQRSKSRRASVGDEPCIVSNRRSSSKEKGHSIGVPLENCPLSQDEPLVPWLVTQCCSVIETRGMEVMGIYRIPGNSASVQYLTAMVNTPNGEGIKLDDPKWSDVNVVSSLIKSFFRQLPEPLLTTALYNHFITVDKIPDCRHRLAGIQALVHKLPPSHFETLRYFCTHLRRVAAHSDKNKMDLRNLSIVLAPTLVRGSMSIDECSMVSMISDMQHQCHITETLVSYSDYLFSNSPMSSSIVSTLVDLEPIPSSSSAESLNQRGEKQTLNRKLSLLPGTTSPALSVKQKIMSFECGKPPVIEENVLSSSYPPSPSKNLADESFMSLTSSIDDPMSLSYHERRVLAQEKAKVFEEETRAVLEKKAFRGREQRMSREQTERRWQEVKRQATLLTRDNSDENIDKENKSSQNVGGCRSFDGIPSEASARPPQSSIPVTCGQTEKKTEEIVMLRTRSGRSLRGGNRHGVVYSPNSSKILKSIVQLSERPREGGGQRKKSRLERRHTIAGSHSNAEKNDRGLNRTPSERKPKMHRSTT